MPAKKVNAKGSQPRNREIKGKPIGWPDLTNNFKWILPHMPAGYPMRNPRIVRFLYENFYQKPNDGNASSCVERAIANGTISQPPIIQHSPGGVINDTASLNAALQAYNCADNMRIMEGDGVTFVFVKDPPTLGNAVGSTCAPTFVTAAEIGNSLKTNNPEKFFEVRPVSGNIFDEIFPTTDVDETHGLYGPRVLTFLVTQRPYAYPSPDVSDFGKPDDSWATYGGGYAWPPTGFTQGILKYGQQSGQELPEQEDRWVQYDTYLIVDTQSYSREPAGALSGMLNDTLKSFGFLSATRVRTGDTVVIDGVHRPLYTGYDFHSFDQPDPYPDSVSVDPNCPDNTKSAVDRYQKVIDDWYEQL